jgi:hypothetical protein
MRTSGEDAMHFSAHTIIVEDRTRFILREQLDRCPECNHARNTTILSTTDTSTVRKATAMDWYKCIKAKFEKLRYQMQWKRKCLALAFIMTVYP